MPSCSQEQHDLMVKWFGQMLVDDEWRSYDSYDYYAAKFLIMRGWTEAAGMWSKPTPSYTPSIYEVECLKYLRDEWDYGWHTPLFPEPLT